ncbi:MAG: ester cyclase [Thermoanaerobaculia bacterium]|nr:ester cyclase [Thermoanaerobaculia bacterium]MBP9826101.1 ester cyclase [Thermoanaerobaculia bacterium]
MASNGKNREIALRWMEEVWNQRREEVIDELMHADAVGHMEGGDVHGPAGFKAARAAFLEALPDLRIAVEDSVAEGDQVVLRWRVTGTHLGTGLGIPPSGRVIEARGMSWFRFRDGQMIEGWDSWDQSGLIQKLTPP